MSEEKSSRTEASNSRPVREQWVSVTDAALLLGVSARTIQKQAASQKLPSRLEGRRLFVCLESREEFANFSQNDANVREQSREEQTSEDSGTVDAERMIAALEQEVYFLRARMEAHEEEIKRRDIAEGELRRLMLSDKNELLALRQKVAILLPSVQDTDSGSPVPQSEAEPMQENRDSIKPKRSLWRRFLGKE